MNAVLLPDNPDEASRVVRLLEDKAKLLRDVKALRAALSRTTDERNYWRTLAVKLAQAVPVQEGAK